MNRQIRRREPGTKVPSLLRRARALFADRKFDGALKVFRQAVQEHGTNPQVLVDAARAFGARYEPQKCDRLLQRALKRAPRIPDLQFIVGESYRMIGDFESAERCFRKAVALTDEAPRAALELAYICERTHRIDEGLNFVTRVFKSWPRSLSATIVKARLLRRRGEVAEAAESLQQALHDTDAKPSVEAEAWGELAETLDAIQQFDDAWDAIGRSKAILRSRCEAEEQAANHVGNRFAELASSVDKTHFERWSQVHIDREQPFALLTGFPRSGTTLLEQVLDAHPMIVSAEEHDVMSAEVFPNLGTRQTKQLPVLEVLESLTTNHIASAQNQYLTLTKKILGEETAARLLIDKNPAMTPMIPVVMRLFPQTRLVVALRDPRDVVLSCYLRYLPLNPVSVSFLDVRTTAERYFADMSAWIRFRNMLMTPHGDIRHCEVRYEDVLDNLGEVARKTIQCLGLEWDDAVLAYRDRLTQKLVRSPSYEAVLRPLHSRSKGRWRNYERQLEPAISVLQPIMEDLGYA